MLFLKLPESFLSLSRLCKAGVREKLSDTFQAETEHSLSLKKIQTYCDGLTIATSKQLNFLLPVFPSIA